MEYRTLGSSGLRVSAVGLGCMGMSHGYGLPADRREMARLLLDAVDMGYTFFDTAELYGTPDNPHDNEELLGSALKPCRNKVVIATKFGVSFPNLNETGPQPVITDSSPESIRKSVEGSLKRLQTDYIDLYYQHRIDPAVEPETVAETMSELMREGKIRYWGISEANEQYLRRAHDVCPVTAVQNRYSMMARWHEALFPTLEELNIGFVAFSPLANGVLTENYDTGSKFDGRTDYRAAMPQFRKDSFEKNKELFEFIRRIADDKHATPSQISLGWMLCKKPWIVPIPGTRHICRLKENAGAADVSLTEEEIAIMDEVLDGIAMSEVFGGSEIIKKHKLSNCK